MGGTHLMMANVPDSLYKALKSGEAMQKNGLRSTKGYFWSQQPELFEAPKSALNAGKERTGFSAKQMIGVGLVSAAAGAVICHAVSKSQESQSYSAEYIQAPQIQAESEIQNVRMEVEVQKEVLKGQQQLEKEKMKIQIKTEKERAKTQAKIERDRQKIEEKEERKRIKQAEKNELKKMKMEEKFLKKQEIQQRALNIQRQAVVNQQQEYRRMEYSRFVNSVCYPQQTYNQVQMNQYQQQPVYNNMQQQSNQYAQPFPAGNNQVQMNPYAQSFPAGNNQAQMNTYAQAVPAASNPVQMNPYAQPVPGNNNSVHMTPYGQQSIVSTPEPNDQYVIQQPILPSQVNEIIDNPVEDKAVVIEPANESIVETQNDDSQMVEITPNELSVNIEYAADQYCKNLNNDDAKRQMVNLVLFAALVSDQVELLKRENTTNNTDEYDMWKYTINKIITSRVFVLINTILSNSPELMTTDEKEKIKSFMSIN